MDFETLMAQATAVAKQQDAALAERARQRRREEDEQRRKEEKLRRAREEQQQMLASVREESEKRQQKLLQEKRQQRQAERQKSAVGKTKSSARKTVPGGSNSGVQVNPLASARLGGKRDAQLSFDELMAKAKAMPSSKSAVTGGNSNIAMHGASSSTVARPSVSGKRPPPSSASAVSSHTQPHQQQQQQQQQQRNTPILFHKKRPPLSSASTTSRSAPSAASAAISTKDRIRQMFHGPPQKINATKRRDARSVSEIHRDIRHSRGVYSDDEDSRTDPRLIRNKQTKAAVRSTSVPSQYKQTRPADPANRPRIPFQRPGERMRRPMPQKRPYDEVDKDLESFIVDDEEDENDYSAEISRIFRYNKSKYADDMFSDDDMEADSREVLREERRSERIGRREDIEEERRELERLKRLKLKGKSRA